jgi:hypothetical protein
MSINEFGLSYPIETTAIDAYVEHLNDSNRLQYCKLGRNATSLCDLSCDSLVTPHMLTAWTNPFPSPSTRVQWDLMLCNVSLQSRIAAQQLPDMPNLLSKKRIYTSQFDPCVNGPIWFHCRWKHPIFQRHDWTLNLSVYKCTYLPKMLWKVTHSGTNLGKIHSQEILLRRTAPV